jgi:hypothetical protein
MAFTSAEDRVDNDSFEAILTVLGGDSPWRDYVRPACAEARKNIPKDVFQVLPQAEYIKALAQIDPKATASDTPGVTNKKDGYIRMEGYFGTRSREAMLGLSLHEVVHLVSHRPGRAGQQHSTAIGVLGEGLLEGLVELVTCNILTAQKIQLADPKRRGHQKRVPVVVELMKGYGVGVGWLGPVLFRGDYQAFHRLMDAAFTMAGWMEIQRLTTSNNPDGAKRRMGELRATAEKARPGAFKTQLAAPLVTMHELAHLPF